MSWWSYKPYVSVAARRAKAKRKLTELAKQGHKATPVELVGREIASSFWGKAWCDHLESFSDYSNRLPRGRTYVRNGSVVDLKIQPGQVVAMVSGSELYKIRIRITPLAPRIWKNVQSQCTGRIGSLVELLQGRLSRDVMQVVTNRDGGLFPKPQEISMECSCPDWAGMCKHLAATLYGVGARLDCQPELLFVMRKVDHRELIAKVGDIAGVAKSAARGKRTTIAAESVAEVFGIELDDSQAMPTPQAKNRRKKSAAPPRPANRKTRSRATSTASIEPTVADQRDDVLRKRQTEKSRGLNKRTHQLVATKTRSRIATKNKRATVGTNPVAARRKTK